jgi:putative transposase
LLHLVRERLPAGTVPGRDAFFNLLAANGLLVRKQKTFRPVTTLSWHHFHKFSNLWKGRIPDAPNQVWVADITYIRLRNDTFIYLSLLTDVYSHKIVGWFLSGNLGMEGPIAALKTALENLPSAHNLMHHSDRGVQYCSKAYVELLQSHGIQISMTENGDPKENSVAERVNGILKEEWLNRETIESLEQGRERIADIIGIYNKRRPHLSNNYLTPEEAHGKNGILKRQWKTYYKKKEDMYKNEEEKVSL